MERTVMALLVLAAGLALPPVVPAQGAPRRGGAAPALAAFERVAGVLDILPTQRAVDPELASWVAERIAARAQARKSKDFKAADAIRAELKTRGVEIEDTPTGTEWKIV